MASPELSLVVPFYNEEEGCERVIRHLVETLDQSDIEYELIAVNNGSVDHTGDILARCARTHHQIKVVTVEENQGYGWGVRSGFLHSKGQYLGYVDGDSQVPPHAIIEVYHHIRQHGVDICKGSRITRHDGIKRKLVSGVYNRLFMLLFPCPATDINAKPKIMTRACYQKLDLHSKDWFIDAEIILKAHALGMQIGEVQIEFLPREQGASKVRIKTVLEFLKNIFVYRFNMKNTLRSLSQSQHVHKP